MKEVEIYTDGACRGNPGNGGYGIVLKHGKHRKELSQGYEKTTNNRMELLASIVALESLKGPCKVKLYSDSRYVVNAINEGWVTNWQAKEWKKKENVDLWKRLLDAKKEHQVEFIWVKGHASNAENNRCDELAVEAATGDELFPDKGYQQRIDQLQAQESLFQEDSE